RKDHGLGHVGRNPRTAGRSAADGRNRRRAAAAPGVVAGRAARGAEHRAARFRARRAHHVAGEVLRVAGRFGRAARAGSAAAANARRRRRRRVRLSRRELAMRLWRAWLTLVWLSFRRLLWSASTLMILFPLSGGALFLLRRRYDRMEDVEAAFGMYSNFLILIFASFMVPICALAYGTASIGGDREDHTLLFVLVRPIPRPLILLAKFAATLP